MGLLFKDPKQEWHIEDAAPFKPANTNHKTTSCVLKKNTKASFALYL